MRKKSAGRYLKWRLVTPTCPISAKEPTAWLCKFLSSLPSNSAKVVRVLSRFARDTLADEDVAIKKIALIEHQVLYKRTLREIRILSRLRHENASLLGPKAWLTRAFRSSLFKQ